MKHKWRYLVVISLLLTLALSACNNLNDPLQTTQAVDTAREAAVELEEALAEDGIVVAWDQAESTSLSEEIQLIRVPTSDDNVRVQAIFVREELTSLFLTDFIDPKTNQIVVGDYFTGRVGTYQVQLHPSTDPGAIGVTALVPKAVEVSLSPQASSAKTALGLIKSRQVEASHSAPDNGAVILSTGCDHLRDHIEDAQRDVNTAAGWLAAALAAWEGAKITAAVMCVVPGPNCVAALTGLATASAALAAATYAYNNARASLESAREAYAAAGCS